MQERIDALQNALLFEEVPAFELRALAGLVREQELQAGQDLTVRGQPLAGMVLLESGALEVLVDSSPICTLSPGSVFCEDALVSDALAPASVRAAIASRVGILDRARMLEELPRLSFLRQALEEAWLRRVLGAALYRIDLFQALIPEARALLLDRFERVELPAGTTLATEGQRTDAFLFIRAGEAQLHLDPMPDAPPDAPTTVPLRAGDYLGDTMLVDDAPHTATVTTEAALVVMQLTRAAFEEALSTLHGQLEAAYEAFRARSESFF